MNNENIVLHCGDCIQVMKEMIERGERIHSIVTDPPYHLTSIVKRFSEVSENDNTKTSIRSKNRSDGMARLARGFMGKKWDGGDIAFKIETWKLCHDLLLPGGYLLAFGGTRTFHRMAVAIEDAGFEIRDTLSWIYGTGFPKSHNLHNEWEGWGTALKPGWEPIIMARKPIIGTVEKNVLTYSTGAININDCRVGTSKNIPASPRKAKQNSTYGDLSKADGTTSGFDENVGRWPANVLHDGSDEVEEVFAKFSDSASRFFYSAKANKNDRAGSDHPTVKPVALMRWLVRLVTPPNGIVLDPFAGSGTTGVAALAENKKAILIEAEPEYQKDIKRRFSEEMEEDEDVIEIVKTEKHDLFQFVNGE